VLIAIAIAAVITGLLAFGAARFSSVNGELSDIRGVRRVAGDFGAATLTYDYRDLKPFERRMRAHATGTFRRQLGEGGLEAIESLIKGLKSTSEATVKQIFVSELEDHSASAIVVVEAQARNGDAPPKKVDAAYLELQLVKAGGRWLIDGVSTLDLGRAVSGPGGTGNSTTTAPPSK
jgi:hypothetical protein